MNTSCAMIICLLAVAAAALGAQQSTERMLDKLDSGPAELIGEFHFGAMDRGMFLPGLVDAGSQKARAESFAAYVRSAVDCPAVVGCHWCQYADEPITGRYYHGENYNIGFVDVTDTPYPELVAAARKVGADIYTRRGRAR